MVAWTVVWRAEQKGLLSVELMGVRMVDVMVLHWVVSLADKKEQKKVAWTDVNMVVKMAEQMAAGLGVYLVDVKVEKKGDSWAVLMACSMVGEMVAQKALRQVVLLVHLMVERLESKMAPSKADWLVQWMAVL